MVIPTHSAAEAAHKLRRNDEDFDMQLMQANLAQNRQKQKGNVSFRKVAKSQNIYSGQISIQGQSCMVAVMLGVVPAAGVRLLLNDVLVLWRCGWLSTAWAFLGTQPTFPFGCAGW